MISNQKPKLLLITLEKEKQVKSKASRRKEII